MNQKLYKELCGIKKEISEIKTLLCHKELGIIVHVKKHNATLYGGNGNREGLCNKVRNIWVIKTSAIVSACVVVWVIFGDGIKAMIFK